MIQGRYQALFQYSSLYPMKQLSNIVKYNDYYKPTCDRQINIIPNNQMKNRSKLATYNNSRPLNLQSKAKVYVPISIPSTQPLTSNTTNSNHSNSHSHSHSHSHSSSGHLQSQNIQPSDSVVLELRKANNQLREKQEIYIDKLLKLEEGLEKQHLQFKQLQDLYNQLFHSYKRKEEEISELEQKYRESNRKKQPTLTTHQPSPSLTKSAETELRKQLEEQKNSHDKLEEELRQCNIKITELNKQIERLLTQNIYYKNKDRMIDSRASLNSKIFEELEEWQKQADLEKEEKIKLDYQNQFLKSRNQDLEERIVELERIVAQKQAQLLGLRQNNIMLTRQRSEHRLRSASRSPRKTDQPSKQQQKGTKSSTNSIISQLYNQIKALKKQLQLQQKRQQVQGDIFIRQQQFYSFSQDQPSNHSSIQSQSHDFKLQKELFIKIQNGYEVEEMGQVGEIGGNPSWGRRGGIVGVKEGEQEIYHQGVPHFAQVNQSFQSLQELPAELQIDRLIEKNTKLHEKSVQQSQQHH